MVVTLVSKVEVIKTQGHDAYANAGRYASTMSFEEHAAVCAMGGAIPRFTCPSSNVTVR